MGAYQKQTPGQQRWALGRRTAEMLLGPVCKGYRVHKADTGRSIGGMVGQADGGTPGLELSTKSKS